MIAILLALLVQSDLDSLVRDLGDDSLEVRERAHRKLLQSGSSCIPALTRVLSSDDVELRRRAASIIDVVGRADRERVHDQKELEALLQQIPEGAKGTGTDATPGAKFYPSARRFKDGWVVSTWSRNFLERRASDGPGRGRLDVDIRSISDATGKDLVVERCGRCSPGKVFVRAGAGTLEVRLTGEQVWFSPYDLEFRNPQEGQQRRVGDFVLEVAWPQIQVSSEREIPDAWTASMGRSFSCHLKERTGLQAPGRGESFG